MALSTEAKREKTQLFLLILLVASQLPLETSISNKVLAGKILQATQASISNGCILKERETRKKNIEVYLCFLPVSCRTFPDPV